MKERCDQSFPYAPSRGSIYVGFYTLGEAIRTHLEPTLEKGKRYRLSFDYRASKYELVSNNLGVYFSKKPLHISSMASSKRQLLAPQINIDSVLYPQDGWSTLTFEFEADDDYKYIALGNFMGENNTIYDLRKFGIAKSG